MGYSFRYINRQIEPTYIAYTLIIDDETSSYRVEKCFKTQENQIDSEFLRAEAQKEILLIIENKNKVEEQEERVDNGDIS